MTKGKLIVGLGRGSSYNIYDYQGFGIDHHEAGPPRRGRAHHRQGMDRRHFGIKAVSGNWMPILRPRPYTKPYPPLIRGSSGDASLVELARQGKPFLMNVQSFETTRAGRAVFADDARGGV